MGAASAGASVQRDRGRGAGGWARASVVSDELLDPALHDQLERVVGTLVELVTK